MYYSTIYLFSHIKAKEKIISIPIIIKAKMAGFKFSPTIKAKKEIKIDKIK